MIKEHKNDEVELSYTYSTDSEESNLNMIENDLETAYSTDSNDGATRRSDLIGLEFVDLSFAYSTDDEEIWTECSNSNENDIEAIYSNDSEDGATIRSEPIGLRFVSDTWFGSTSDFLGLDGLIEQSCQPVDAFAVRCRKIKRKQ